MWVTICWRYSIDLVMALHITSKVSLCFLEEKTLSTSVDFIVFVVSDIKTHAFEMFA